MVKYNIIWSSIHGKDVNNKHDRPFDLLKLCPSMDFEKSTEEEVFVYKNCFNYKIINDLEFIFDFIKNKKKLYIDMYPNIPDSYLKQVCHSIDLDKFHYNTLDSKNLELCNELKSGEASVAIHVRLGDSYVMTGFKNIFNSSYEEYANYIIDSIYIMQDKLNPLKPKFFFFSDDVDWVSKNIIPKLDSNVSYKLNLKNNPPYLDIYLISTAKHQIISLGGFGKLASLFNKNENKIIISPDNIQSLRGNY